MGSWLPWRKLASNPPGLDWPALPWQARGLYALLLGLADDAGVIRLGKLGLQSLAGALRASWPELEPHFDALVTTGWAEVQEGAVMLPHFVDSQRAATTNERVAQYRERARNAPVTPEKRDGNEKLPKSNDDVTKSYPDKNRKDKNRKEEKEEKRQDKKPSGASADDGPAQLGMPLGDEGAVKQSKDEDPDPVAVEQHLAIHVFGYLLAARKRCKPSARTVEPTETHLKEITRCLREGIEAQDLIHVVDVWEAQVKSGRQEMAHFDSVTPFRASNVGKYLQMGLDDAAKPRGSMQAYGRNQKPESDLEKLGRHFRERREARERGDVIEVEPARMLDERRDDE